MKQKILLLLVFFPYIGFAQTWKNVINNEEYLWGIGNGATITEADRRALADLVGKITTFVSSDTSLGFKEESDGVSFDHHSYVENNIKTYSQATLTNTERITLKNEPNARVGRFIKKIELKRIFSDE